MQVMMQSQQRELCNHIKYRVQLFEENLPLIFPNYSIEFVHRNVSQKALKKSNISRIVLKLQNEDELIYLRAKESVEFWNFGIHSFFYKPFVRECLFYQIVEETSEKLAEIEELAPKCFHFTSYSYEDFCEEIRKNENKMISCLPSKPKKPKKDAGLIITEDLERNLV